MPICTIFNNGYCTFTQFIFFRNVSEKYQVVKLWTLFCRSGEALMSIMQTQARSYNLWPAKNLLEQLSCGILMVLSMLGNNNKIHLPSSLSSNQGDRPNQSLASCRYLGGYDQHRWCWRWSSNERSASVHRRWCNCVCRAICSHRQGWENVFFLRLCLQNTNVDSFSLKLNKKSVRGKIDKKH